MSRSLLTAAALLSALAPAACGQGAAAQGENDRPNILFVIADDWGWPHAGVYGTDWVNTPNFDRVATGGALFENAFTSNPKCSPCRASILTGRNSWQTGEAINHFGVFPNTWPAYPDLLEKGGYKIGYTGKGWGPGDYEAGGWERNPAGPAYQQARTKPPASGMGNIDYAGNFDLFLKERDAEAGDDPANRKPFHFWLGTYEPHRAYEAGSGVAAGKSPARVDVPSFYPDTREIREDLLDYALEVEYFDTHLGRALALLEERGELANTLVVVTSDHGMPFPRVKGQIYEWGFHLPLAIMGPGVSGGVGSKPRTVKDFVNVRDFAPTFLEVAGLPRPDSFTGKSLTDLLSAAEGGKLREGPDEMLVGKERHDVGRPNDAGYPVRALRTPDYLYIRNFTPERWPAGNPETGYRNVDDSPTKSALTRRFNEHYRLSFGKRPAEELYALPADRDNMTNLAEDPAYRGAKTRLRNRMYELLEAEGDPRMTGRAWVFDDYRYSGNATHGWEAFQEFSEPE
ncbi:sulfatase family protein [Alienimonas californiensis]|uniref:Choline-sulfatase n=1 Tax=Alienimonas californiensis TaxID=2527989 RepID=A0A517P3S7_9PLAN|nr:sulfatase [Alienimonas californiensis]QDT14024.1 Choline-sulfatase [Alienimonas californiensis]